MITGRGSGPKNRIPRTIDQPAPVQGGGGQPLTSEQAQLEAPVPTIPPPFGLTVTSKGVERSGPAPSAFFVLRWYPAPGTPPGTTFDLEYDTASDFTAAPILKSTATTEGTVRGAPVVTTIYFRVRAVVGGFPGEWSAAISDSVGSADDTPPDPVTGASSSWSPLTGDLLIECTPPTGERVRGVIYRIYTGSGGTLLRETDPIGGTFTWTKQMMTDDRGGTLPLPASASCYVVINAVSWVGNESTDVTLSPTRPAPATPAGLATSWDSDDGTAGPDLEVALTPDPASVIAYRLTVDGVAQPDSPPTSSVIRYPFERNRAEHSGTPDPVLSLSLVGVDALGQTSAVAASTTATNAAPPATTLTAFAGSSSVGLTIVPSAARDLRDYEVKVRKDGVLVDTVYFTDPSPTYTITDGTGAYTFTVAPRDVFGQVATASAETVGVDLIDWDEFVTDLRSGLSYTDSLGTAAATLAALKDGDTAVSAVTYAGGATWKWTEGDWQQDVTHRTTEIAVSSAAGANKVYIGVSTNGVSWLYYYGGTPASGRWTPSTWTATEATAQAGAVTLANGAWRIDLPTPVPARYIRIGHRNTTASYDLAEFFPSTLIRGTYIEAESITSVEIAVGSLTGDRLTATAIDGFVITGATIQTAASGERVVLDSTGLKTYDSAGVVQVEATTATDGRLTAGGGVVKLDQDGIYIISGSLADPLQTYSFVTSGGDYMGGVSGYTPIGDERWVNLVSAGSLGGADLARVTAVTGRTSAFPSRTSQLEMTANQQVTILLQANTTDRFVRVTANNVFLGTSGAPTTLDVSGGINVGSATGATTGQIKASGTVTLSAGLNVGTATGAGTGEIRASGTIQSATSLAVNRTTAGTNSQSTVQSITLRSTGTVAAGFGINQEVYLEDAGDDGRLAASTAVVWDTATGGAYKARWVLNVYDSGGARQIIDARASGASPMLGFFGTNAITRPNVTGSRGGNAALTSLIQQLVALGLITESTSA